MNALWKMFIQLGKWFGLAVIALALFGGLINGVVLMTRDFWTGFYWMFSTWVFGIWMGVLLIAVCKLAEKGD